MIQVLTILAAGVVIWWFVKPGSNGVTFVAGLAATAIDFFKFLVQGKT